MSLNIGRRRFTATPETPLVFVHIFKCAGTSVHDYLASAFDEKDIYPGRLRHEFNKIQLGYSVYSGHMIPSQWDGLPVKPHFVTWLRHPIPRVASAFYFLATTPTEYVDQDQDPERLRKIASMSLKDFVASDDADIEVDTRNGMAKTLEITNIFAGVATLSRYAFVGIAENTQAGLRQLADRFGLQPPNKPFLSNLYEQNARHRGDDISSRYPLTDALKRQIGRQSRLDMNLYRAAKWLSPRMT